MRRVGESQAVETISLASSLGCDWFRETQIRSDVSIGFRDCDDLITVLEGLLVGSGSTRWPLNSRSFQQLSPA